jgi:hypothetical protein
LEQEDDDEEEEEEEEEKGGGERGNNIVKSTGDEKEICKIGNTPFIKISRLTSFPTVYLHDDTSTD